MKTNEGTKPTPRRGINRIGSPRLIAIVSSGISLIIVIVYFYFFDKKENNEINEKDKTVYLSRTPERAAESFLAALTENEIERALKLCKGSIRKAVLEGSIFRQLTETGEYPEKTPRIEETSIRLSINTSVDSVNERQKSVGLTPKVATTRSLAARDQSTGKRKPSPNIEFPRAEPKKRNNHFPSLEPLVFVIHESHREERNRVLLVGTLERKNTDRVYFRGIEMTVERSESSWYVTRVRFK